MKRKWFGLFVIAVSIIVTLVSYPYLPDKIPTHWNYKGAPDDFGEKSFSLFMLPVLMIVMYLLTFLLPKIDPKKRNFEKFQGTYLLAMNGIILFLFLIQSVQIASALGIVDSKFIVPELMGFIFIFIGNISPKFKPNYFVGIRTPWTLANEEVWKKTHRFGGKVFVVSGLLLMLVPIMPAVIQPYYDGVILIGCLALTALSSYYFFIKL